MLIKNAHLWFRPVLNFLERPANFVGCSRLFETDRELKTLSTKRHGINPRQIDLSLAEDSGYTFQKSRPTLRFGELQRYRVFAVERAQYAEYSHEQLIGFSDNIWTKMLFCLGEQLLK